MAFKDMLQSNVVNPLTHATESISTVGIVTASDESNNTCSISYIDKDGKSCNKDNVAIRLYGNGADWFPKKGDHVLIQDSGDNCVVVARYVGNYAMDVRSKRQLKQDINSEESGCQPPGGQIM